MNTERISLMEQRLDRATAALSAFQTALDQYENVLNDIDTLNTTSAAPNGTMTATTMLPDGCHKVSNAACSAKMPSGTS